MQGLFRAVPGLFWLAVVWIGVAVWANDVRGAYIAMFCMVLGTVQLFRAPNP